MKSRLSGKLFDNLTLKNCYIAGGAILSQVMRTKINDYDIYPFYQDEAWDIVFDIMDSQGALIIGISDRSVTLRSGDQVFQVITFKDFRIPDDIFESFDFTVCMAAYNVNTKEYTFHDDFYPDIATRHLRFNPKTNFPLASLIRTYKYKHKGFNPNRLELIKMAIAIGEANPLTSWDDVEQAIGGIYGKNIKLECADEEFSIERLYQVLEEIDIEALYDELKYFPDAIKFSYEDLKYIKKIIKNEKIRLKKNGHNIEKYCLDDHGDVYEFDNDTEITIEKLEYIYQVFNKEPDYDVIDMEYIYGYKYLVKSLEESDKYLPGVYKTNRFVYNGLHEKTTCLNSPYLYFHTSMLDAHTKYVSYNKNKDNGCIVKVLIPTKDIMSRDTAKSMIIIEDVTERAKELFSKPKKVVDL